MGNWTLIISGTGCHHNNDPKGHYGQCGAEEDADQRLLEFADRLGKDGHTISNAAIIHGGGADTVAFAYQDGLLVPEEYIRADGTRERAQILLGYRRDRRRSNGVHLL